MIRDAFPAALRATSRFRTPVAIGVIGMLALLVGSLFIIPLDSSLTMMLPKGSESVAMIRMLEELDLSGKVILSVSPHDTSLSRRDFLGHIEAFADALQPPLITRTIFRVTDEQMIGDLQFFLDQTPALLTDADYTEMDTLLTPEGVDQLLRRRFMQLMKPEGAYLAGMIQRDPLDLQSRMMTRIQRLATAFGYTLRITDQHIFSADGRHLLMILETPIPFTDSKGSRELVTYIRDRQQQFLGPGIAVDMICGHLHSLSNETVIRGDIRRTMTIAGLAFALLFLFWFRDIRAVVVFLIPFAGLLVGIPAAAVFTGALSPMILGFGCVIAGISVDYGIHVYVAIRRHPSPVDAVLAIARPLAISALTTAAVFIAFFATRIAGYHQLAVMALVSITASLGAALFLMPMLIPPGVHPARLPDVQARGMPPRWIMTGFLLLLLICIPVASRVSFSGDIRGLDGSEPEIFETEVRFRETWGDGEQDQAVITVRGNHYENVLEQSYQVYAGAVARLGADAVSSFHSVWKPAAQRRENLRRWQAFWDASRRTEVERLLRETGAGYGFADDAFLPFFNALDNAPPTSGEPVGNVLFDHLKSRFVQQRNGTVTSMLFVQDTETNVAELMPLVEQAPEVKLVSRRALSRHLTSDYTREIVRIITVASVLMLAAVFLLLGRIKLALIALTPALAAVPALLAALTLLQVPLNVVSLIAAIVVTGLCIDYGIFYSYACMYRLDADTPVAVALSAGTTLAGAGALLFANHPALFSIGLTLVCGVSAGYLTARLVIPACCRLCTVEESP